MTIVQRVRGIIGTCHVNTCGSQSYVMQLAGMCLVMFQGTLLISIGSKVAHLIAHIWYRTCIM